MSFYSVVLIPILFGLIGFFEPCSLGVNVIFLNRMKYFNKKKRVIESLIFSLVRGFFLAVAGLSASLIGNQFITIQSSLFIILGIVYSVMGVLSLIHAYKPFFTSFKSFSSLVHTKNVATLGIAFGLVIPACAIAFVVALIGNALIVGDLFAGFFSLFIFGVTLSLPLLFISLSDHSIRIIKIISSKVQGIKWLAGVVLLLIGILTVLSSIWWSGAVI